MKRKAGFVIAVAASLAACNGLLGIHDLVGTADSGKDASSDVTQAETGGPDDGTIDAPGDADATPDATSDATPDATPDAPSGDDAPEIDSGTIDGVPPPPNGGTAPSTTTQTFAVHHLHLGDEIGPSGSPDWSRYGYDLDGKTTTAASTDVCALFPQSNVRNQVDGPGGIDNSFGSNIAPLLSAVVANLSPFENSAVASGSFTWMLQVTGLTTDPTQSSRGLAAQTFVGVPFAQGPNASGSTPTFTTSDDWPLDPALVTSAIGSGGVLAIPVRSKYPFSGSYITGGEFVSGAPATLKLVILLGGAPFPLVLQHAVVTFEHSASGHAASGIIAGVIQTQDLVNSLLALRGDISTSLCGSATFQQLVTATQQASDIMSDGTNGPGQSCDAVSIGIGFDADEIGPPLVAGAATVTTNPCDGG